MTPSRERPAFAVLALVSVGVFVAALDQTVVVTALPEVMRDIQLPFTRLDDAAWIVTAYLLGYTVAMPLVGRLADVYGHPRIYQAALIFFAAGSLLVALSSSLPWIVAARMVQAIGGGATVPIGLALASSTLPDRRRGMAIGLVAAAAEMGSVLGPLYGGAIIDTIGWRWIFWLNIPLAAALVVALAALHNRPQHGQKVDYAGGLLLAGFLALVSFGLAQRSTFNFSSPFPYMALAGGIAIGAALAFAEIKAHMALLTPVLFKSKAFVAANGVQLLVGIALIVALVNIPLMTDTVMGREPLEGALRLLRLTAAIPAGALIGGALLSSLDARFITVAGLALMAAGFYMMSGWTLDIQEPRLTFDLVVGGLGFGLVIAPIVASAIGAAPTGYAGTAASLVTVARMMGMTLGLAALSAWGMGHFQTSVSGVQLPLPKAGEGNDAYNQALTQYQSTLTQAGLALFRDLFRAAGVISLLAVLPALAMKDRQRGPQLR